MTEESAGQALQDSETPTPQAFTIATNAVVEEAKAISVGTRETAQAAVDFITKRLVRMQATAGLVKKAADQEHKQACNAEKALENARQRIERDVLAWHDAEKTRVAGQAIDAAQAGREARDDLKLRQAEQLSEEGRHREADALLGSTTMAPVTPTASVELDGAKEKPNWVGECYDLRALAAAAIDPDQPTIPIEAIEVNKKLLGQQARSLKASFAWPGCKAENKAKLKLDV